MGAAKRKERAEAERWLQLFLGYQPHLADCDREQIREVHEALRSIQIDPSGLLGQVVYRKVGDWAVPLLTPHGLLGLILRGPGVVWADCRAVYEADTFGLDYGVPVVQHAPYAGKDALGALTGAFVVAATQTARFIEYAPASIAVNSPHSADLGSADKVVQRAALEAFAASCPLDLWWLHAGLEIETRVVEARRPIAPWIQVRIVVDKQPIFHELTEVPPVAPEQAESA